MISVQRQDDIDRLALQHELVELKKGNNEYKSKFQEAQESLNFLTGSHQESLKTIDHLSNELKAERLKVIELEHQQKVWVNQKKSEKDLLAMIDDLKGEIKLLEEEQARLISVRFGVARDDQYEQELQKLQDKIRLLELADAEHLKERSNLHHQLQQLSGNFSLVSIKIN